MPVPLLLLVVCCALADGPAFAAAPPLSAGRPSLASLVKVAVGARLGVSKMLSNVCNGRCYPCSVLWPLFVARWVVGVAKPAVSTVEVSHLGCLMTVHTWDAS